MEARWRAGVAAILTTVITRGLGRMVASHYYIMMDLGLIAIIKPGARKKQVHIIFFPVFTKGLVWVIQ